MAKIVVNEKDATLILNGRVIEDLPTGDIFTIKYDNPVSSQTIGVNGGVVAKKRVDAFQGKLTFRLLRFSEDDSFIQTLINQDDLVLFDGSLKVNFQRDGVDGIETYTLKNGTIDTRGDVAVNNTEGQDVVEYTIAFAEIIRTV